jgi:hypothetical protein
MESLEDLCRAVQVCIADAESILQRAGRLKEQRAAGLPYAEIVTAEARPLIVEVLSGMSAQLSESGSRWRREEARALHAEGLSMDRIAVLFGVTRQRVSALLRGAAVNGRAAGDP